MERYAWKHEIYEGKLDEYIRRHDEIWPEMTDLLNRAGIHNYSIWQVGNEIFGYYECAHGIEFAAATQAESEVVKKWDTYMSDLIKPFEKDPVTGAQPKLTQVFLHQ